MKRDLDLIRQILIATEQADDYTLNCGALVMPEHDVRSIAQHCKLLEEAGLLDASLVVVEGHGAVNGLICRLTWAGHEFLDAARSNTTWARAKQAVGQKVGSVPFDVLYAFLVSFAKVQLGLPAG